MTEDIPKEYIRVSEVLSLLKSFEGVPPEILKNKCEIGTKVHEALEADICGSFPILDEASVPYYESFVKWKKITKCIPVIWETRYYDHVNMLTGKIDALMLLPPSHKLVLIDYKTSSQEQPEVWKLQAHLYVHLLNVNNIKVDEYYMFLKLDKNGETAKACIYTYDESIMERALMLVSRCWEKKREKVMTKVDIN